MVAYSFQKRFVPAIEAGYKRQTIRAQRWRHARPGELIQLYQGMRTRHCRKIIPDPRCARIEAIWLDFDRDFRLIGAETASRNFADLEAFAVLDGFAGRDDMSAFWRAAHPDLVQQLLGDGLGVSWYGVLIEWEPVAPAPETVAA